MNIQIVFDALTNVLTDILRAVPGIINGIIVLVVGSMIAWSVRLVMRFVLQRIGVDALVERLGVIDGLRGLGVTTQISRVIAQTVFVFLLLSFAITATRVMGILAIALLLEQILTYLPSLIGAVIVFLLGSEAARYIGDIVTRVARSNNLGYARNLGRAVQYLILIFVAVLAISSLGVDTTILVTMVTIGGAGFALALGLSLGFGARTLVRDILASYYVRDRFPIGGTVHVGDVRGEVQGLGAVNTVVNTADASVVIPNSTLLRTIIYRPHAAPDAPTEAPPEPPPANS